MHWLWSILFFSLRVLFRKKNYNVNALCLCHVKVKNIIVTFYQNYLFFNYQKEKKKAQLFVELTNHKLAVKHKGPNYNKTKQKLWK